MTTQLTTETIILIILAITAGIISIILGRYYAKSMQLRKEAETIRESAKQEIWELNQRNKSLSDHVNFLQNQTTFGSTKPLRYGMAKTNLFFDVFAVYETIDHNHETCILIKRFDFGDDRDFALLEAQELLDHLNEK